MKLTRLILSNIRLRIAIYVLRRQLKELANTLDNCVKYRQSNEYLSKDEAWIDSIKQMVTDAHRNH